MENEQIKVLDSGYVRLIRHWGSDQAVIEAARMSTMKGFLGWEDHYRCKHCQLKWNIQPEGLKCDEGGKPCSQCDNYIDGLNSLEQVRGDENLLRYLYENKHMSPFEMCGATFEIKAPIFVFREWHRHRTQSYNEASARYSPLPNDNYHPDALDIHFRAKAASKNKQAGQAVKREPTIHEINDWLEELSKVYDRVQDHYTWGLNIGIPKEVARIALPVGRYSQMQAQATLRNWLSFLELRNSPYAQQEIRYYAIAVQQILSEVFPRTLQLFKKGR